MKNIDICGLGSSIVDQQFKVNEDVLNETGLQIDQMTLAEPADHQRILKLLAKHNCKSIESCGGSATNTIVAASYFGSDCHHMCFVANDDAGKTYLSALEEAGVTYSAATESFENLPTGKCLVLVTPDGKRTMSTCLGISQFFDARKLDLTVIEQTKYVYVEGYMVTGEHNFQTTLTMLEKAKSADAKIALSLSDPWVAATFTSQLQQLCDFGVDLLFCNDAEAQAFTGTHTLQDAEQALKKFAKQFVITCGANGARLFDGEQFESIVGIKVDVVDTNGAGDMFAGAFLNYIVQGKTFKEAGQFANEAAARLVQHFGARLVKEDYVKLVH
tara:strand:+ start:842 stop:1831 length:990 start_codon:yes stop_codon:yes gene_type:complete